MWKKEKPSPEQRARFRQLVEECAMEALDGAAVDGHAIERILHLSENFQMGLERLILDTAETTVRNVGILFIDAYGELAERNTDLAQVLNLLILGGYPIEKVAKTLGMTIEEVSRQEHRAMKLIRRALLPFGISSEQLDVALTELRKFPVPEGMHRRLMARLKKLAPELFEPSASVRRNRSKP